MVMNDISMTVPLFLIIRSTLITGQSDSYWNTNEYNVCVTVMVILYWF